VKKIIILIFFTGTAIGALFFILRKSPTITNYPPEGKTIIAFGDSLVEGVGATRRNDFPSLLENMIGEPIINLGIAGDTSERGLVRVESVNKEDPRVVLVLFGGNDFLQKVPITETFKNIDDIVVKLQKEGAVVVLLGVKGGLLSDQYAKYFEDIAKARGTLYVPNVLAGLIGHGEFMSDGIHPNDAGYKKIAEKIHPIFMKVLK